MSHATQLHNRRYLHDYLEIINRHGLPGNVKNEICRQMHQAVTATVKGVLEHSLEEELTQYLGLARYEHLPWGRRPELTRSGTYGRELLTQYGRIADLRVPKLRRGNRELRWQTIQRYERCWGPLLDHHLLGYCLGLSLRDLQEVMYDTLGEVVSLAACHRLVWEVEAQVQAWKNATIEAPPAVLMVDGMWVKIAYPTGAWRQDAQGRLRSVKRKEKRVVLSALGLWEDGHWEIVHWQIAPGENQACWHHFLGDLYRKGITEETTKLVVSDGSKGLESALDYHYYGVPHQRCIFHKIKNLTDHLVFEEFDLTGAQGDTQAERQARAARRKAILADAGAVYERHGEAEIRQRAALFHAKWQQREPAAIAAFFVDFDKTLSYLRVDLPEALLPLVRTTNLLERFHRETRRKQHDIGMFHSEHGCEVLWYLMAMRETAKQQALVKCHRCRL
jgi:transposase-like protein